MTGETCLAAILRYELHQQAFGTGLRMLQMVEIETGGRILENKIRTPWKGLPFSVPTGIEEGEFGRKTWRTSRLSDIGRSRGK
jgi:hypothetical protein